MLAQRLAREADQIDTMEQDFARSRFDRLGCDVAACAVGGRSPLDDPIAPVAEVLASEARHRGLPSCALTFEPHPRDHFARKAGRPELAPPRIATLRDKLCELQRCGIDEVVVLPFNDRFASMSPEDFIARVLQRGLRARYLLVGDDFQFGARRAGNYAMLDAAGPAAGFDVARMLSYEMHGLRVSSSAVRDALAEEQALSHYDAPLLERGGTLRR